MTKLYVRWDDDGLQAATAAEIVAALRANEWSRAEVLAQMPELQAREQMLLEMRSRAEAAEAKVAELEAELAALVPRSAMREAGRVPVTPIYQNGRYRVTREPAGDGTLYVVIGPTGRVYGPPMALRAAVARADMYQAEDDAEASTVRHAAAPVGVCGSAT